MYQTLGSAIRLVLEKKAHGHMAPDGGPEKDMNDQVSVGSYQSKSFEMSADAQKLYSNLPKDTPSAPAEAAAVSLDKLFDIDKDTTGKDFASDEDLKTAHSLADKIRRLGKEMNLEDEHEKIVQKILDRISDHHKKNLSRVIDPDEHLHPSDDPRFGNTTRDYSTDRTSDRDSDNVKHFLIRRSLRAQRKLKIIDND